MSIKYNLRETDQVTVDNGRKISAKTSQNIKIKYNETNKSDKILSIRNDLKLTTNNKSPMDNKFRGFFRRFITAKWALFWLCWVGGMQGLIVNGFINVVITTIERRFGLRSAQSGLIASGYDIASFFCLVPVSYLGGRAGVSKPKWIAWGAVLMGIGSAIFALPHFLVGQYRATGEQINICMAAGNSTQQSCAEFSSESSESTDISWNVWLFFLAQLLHGAGAAPLFTLGVTYIDENVSKKMSSVYLGIYYTMAIVGPALGYVIGGQILLIYTDFLVVDPNSLGITSESNVWIGAWWIGFVFTAVICISLALPLFWYPISLPGAEELQQERISEAHNGNTSISKTFTRLRDIPKALLTLVKNPTFFFLNLGCASEGLIIAGFAVFLPKQIENQFSVSPVWAALLMGLITVPAGGGGTFLGGYLVKRLKLTCSGIIRLCLYSTIVALIFTTSLLLGCPNLKFAGVSSAYTDLQHISSIEAQTRSSTLPSDSRIVLDSSCNSKCGCSQQSYDPICGGDGVMYYSPCYAGCSKELEMEGNKVYLHCDCIELPVSTNSSYDAINTMCESTCSRLPYFTALCFMLMFFTFLASMPALSATLRCIHDDQRSFGLGIQWIKVRLLGTIPAPLIFGAIIDETCLLWQESCNGGGNCLVYDNIFMSRYMWILAMAGKGCSVLFFFAAWWFYIPPKEQINDATEDMETAQEEQQQVTSIASVKNNMNRSEEALSAQDDEIENSEKRY